MMIKAKCKNCSRIFWRPPRRFNEAIKRGWNHFCSLECQLKFRTTRKILICENCGKKFERKLSSISVHNYCSQSCGAIVNNKRYDHRRLLPTFKTCKQCGIKYRKGSGNKKYCSRTCATADRCYSRKELLDIIKTTAKKLKRVPARREFWGGVDKACVRLFGSWNKAVAVAGLIPNRSHDDRMYKRVSAKSTDGHLCDSISEVLIDNWLCANKIAHIRDVRYPSSNHLADWQLNLTGKQVFVEYFGLVNDSPRYDKSIKEKLSLCRKQKIPLIAIYPKDLYPKVYLDNNLKNKFKDYLSL